MLRDCCSDTVKAALIIGGAIIVAVTIAVSAAVYFGAFQTCLRSARIVESEAEFTGNRLPSDRYLSMVTSCARNAAGAPRN